MIMVTAVSLACSEQLLKHEPKHKEISGPLAARQGCMARAERFEALSLSDVSLVWCGRQTRRSSGVGKSGV